MSQRPVTAVRLAQNGNTCTEYYIHALRRGGVRGPWALKYNDADDIVKSP